MCGIFALAMRGNGALDRTGVEAHLRSLFLLSETRGKEAAGLALQSPDSITIHTDAQAASRMIASPAYRTFLKKGLDSVADGHSDDSHHRMSAVGHSRLVTNGLQGVDANNQPIGRHGLAVVHNGIVVNVDALWAKYPMLERHSDVDTEVISALLRHHLDATGDIAEAVSTTLNEIVGETSIAVVFGDYDVMVLATNTGSLYFGANAEGTAITATSERYTIDQTIKGQVPLSPASGEHLRPGEMLLIELSTLATKRIRFSGEEGKINGAPAVLPQLGTMRRIELKSDRDRDLRAAMKRCTKCLLTETMPFIDFDEHGVCNYCRNHEPVVYEGEEALEKALAPFRRTDGRPDCLVAFSGGRDSSYGLHLLKKKYDLNPIAYTYDWGMVTDLARRNQARICGRLGIEHIWVSADIKYKRANIRRNVLAWMRRPSLGIIPLFMAGDKQFFHFANQTMKQADVELIIFCDNQFEKTDFKAGFSGVAPAWHTGKRHYKLGVGQKAAMLAYYGKEALLNPALINRSIPDTLRCYASYYLMKSDFLPFFGYEVWDEETLTRTLLDEYDWEIARDTTTTWRIGDGTAPFYNYVYRTVAGFNEHDTFRSNQVREGVISRDEAMRLVEEESEPRWDSIREYTQLVQVDFDELLRTVNSIPRLYDR